jgi:Tfp pilus assembly protein PilF
MAHSTIQALATLLALAALTTAPVSQAAPYIPASGGLVVELLPRRADATQRELRQLRDTLSAHPDNLALATNLAQRYIALGRDSSDPRYLGYAQAALAPWWRLAAPPPELRLLRATLLQSAHHFDAALADLDQVVAARPKLAQAWLTRATVQTVRGDYDGATASCARVSALANELVAVTCLANIGAVTGRALQSEQLLNLTLQRSAGAPPEVALWSLTLLAEMAARRGAADLAETRFRRALALAPRDGYLLGAYADFLLDQQRPAEVLTLLREHSRVDALLLRRALALRQMPGMAAELAADVCELAARFDAATQRGDSVHQREQARFELALRRNPGVALALARRNWQVQKEPADIRIYLDAALHAHNAGAAQPVLDWIAAHGSEDVAAAQLARQLKGGV